MSDNPQLSGNHEAFLLGLGKTLSRMSLYSINHPMTTESLKGSYETLIGALAQQEELTVSRTEDNKILVDGTPLSGAGTIEQTLVTLFTKFSIQGLTFKKGTTFQELVSFFKLLTLKEDAPKDPQALQAYFEKENLKNVQLDQAFYARVSKDKKPGMAGAGAGSGTGSGGISEWMHKLEEMPMDAMIREVIQKAVPNPEDQKKVYELIFQQLQNEIHDHVRRATLSLEREKQELVNASERTVSVLNHIAEGAVVVDEMGRVIMMNPAAERIYGATLSDLKGKPLQAVSQDYLMITLSKDIIETPGREFSKEVSVLSAEHTQQVLKNSSAVITNPEGKVVGIMSVLNDVAKQRELQRMQNDFMGHVTHELRSPLTSIKASLGTLFDDNSNMSPQQQQILSIANRNIDRLARLINDLLDTTKLEAGKMTVDPKPNDTAKLLNDAAVSLESWAKSKQLTLSFENPGGLPKVMADPDRMTQVLVNLISNAIKFTPKGGRITLKAAPLGAHYVRISVTDSGPGISKDDQAKLFSKFSQLAQKEKSDTPGTGLGLYIAKTIVEMHRGQLGIDSEPGRGTTFFFTLPVAVETAKGAAQTAAQAQQQVMESKKKGWLSRLFGG